MISQVQASNVQDINTHKSSAVKAIAIGALASAGTAACLVKAGKGEAVFNAVKAGTKKVAEKARPVIETIKSKAQPIIGNLKNNKFVGKVSGFISKGVNAVKDFFKGAKFAELKGEAINIYISVKEGIANSLEFFKNKAKFNPQFADQASKAAETFNNFVKKSV